jgi:hypothetical protein
MPTARLSKTLAVLVTLAAMGVTGPSPAAPAGGKEATHVGRPTVKLDALVVPPDFPPALERHLKFVLRKAARRVDWGAGRGAHIEFRFVLREFTVTRDGDVLRVHCNALGKLPGGMHASSRLSFGGEPKEQDILSKRVLEVVARGVVSRLADLERQRRAAR